jgi:hypothetical protein
MDGVLIDETGNEINIGNECVICLEKMSDNNKYKIEECQHEFHSECLLSYFRVSTNTNCPLCRNGYKTSDNLKIVLNHARRKNANKKILKEVNKYRKLQQLVKDNKKELKEFKETHKDILKLRNGLITKRRDYGFKLRRMKNKLRNMVLVPSVFVDRK